MKTKVQNRGWRICNEGHFRVEVSTYSTSTVPDEMNIPPQTAFSFKLQSCRLHHSVEVKESLWSYLN